MSDVVVTVPQHLWDAWIEEGDLPGSDVPSPLEPGDEWTFYIPRTRLPRIHAGERVYIVAHGKLRGYAPLTKLFAPDLLKVRWDEQRALQPPRAALCRRGGAVAVTISTPIRGFRGWRYRWWDRSMEKPFPEWRTP